jgi:hypothetical protein
MIPGPYSIAFVHFENEGSDSPSYRVLRLGFDTASKAYAAVHEVAVEAGVPESDCTIIRQIDREEAAQFYA